MKRVLAVAAVVLLAPSVWAEPTGPLVHEEKGRVSADVAPYAGFGFDGAIGTTLGAAIGIARLGARPNIAAFADVSWMVGAADFDDFRVRIGARGDVLRYKSLRLQLAVVPEVVQTSNLSFTGTSIGTEFRLAPGLDVGRWTIEAQASLDQQWLTHIDPSATYTANAYGARSGWYGVDSTVWRAGLRGAVRLSSLEISLAAGFEYTGALDFLPPFYATLSLAYVLPVGRW